MGQFDGEKYLTAAGKALSFIKAQMDINNFTHKIIFAKEYGAYYYGCLLYTSPSPRDSILSRMPSSA